MSGRGDSSRRWLQAADAAEVSGNANRASTIAADSSGGHTCGDRGRFASARTAGRALQVPRAIGAAIEQVVRLPGHQHLGSVGDAKHNCSSILQTRDQRRIMRRDEPGAKPRS